MCYTLAVGYSLIGAVRRGENERVVQHVHLGAPVDFEDYKGWTPLDHAAAANQCGTLDFLVARSRRLRTDRAFSDRLLIRAALAGCSATVRKLLSLGADVNTRQGGGLTPLMVAAMGRSSETVRLLLQSGAHPNDTDNDGCTALMHAAGAGDAMSVRELLLHGADIDIRSKKGNSTALRCAEQSGSAETVYLLRKLGTER
jgi:ankyrin repeat protein